MIDTPIVNYVFQWSDPEIDLFQKELFEVHTLHYKYNTSSVKCIQQILGKQKRCETYAHRNYIWEGHNWKLYVSKEGISFCVMEGLSKEEVKKAWYDFRNKLGL